MFYKSSLMYNILQQLIPNLLILEYKWADHSQEITAARNDAFYHRHSNYINFMKDLNNGYLGYDTM